MGRNRWVIAAVVPAMLVLANCRSIPKNNAQTDPFMHRVNVQCSENGTTDTPCIQEARHICRGDARFHEVRSRNVIPITQGVEQTAAPPIVQYDVSYACIPGDMR
ncbi:MAG TPA: hypothetical protein VIM98_18380 [Dyella sp.]|uniref:hypothetical protein n=1 Tax=Dyella sp. TaxID=1869338 RepID=UPI002F95D782